MNRNKKPKEMVLQKSITDLSKRADKMSRESVEVMKLMLWLQRLW